MPIIVIFYLRSETVKRLSAAYSKLAIRLSQLKYWDFWYRRKIKKVLGLTETQKRSRGIDRTVRLIGNFPGLWQRTIEQTPGGSCQWGRTLFVASGDADRYLILNAIHAPRHGARVTDEALPKADRVWALHMEPAEYLPVLGYDQGEEHAAVSRFYTNSRPLLDKQGIYRPSPPYVHFNLGVSWEFLKKTSKPKKTVVLGIISSDLTDLEGHVDRIRFLERLDSSGIEYILWGRGEGLKRFKHYHGFVQSKWEAHSACFYSIVIENSVSPLYWSEKVADALLAYCLPLYHGCPELGRYLPKDCVIPLDIRRPDAIDRIRDAIAANEYDKRYPSVLAAREIILQSQNFYSFIDRELNAGA